jgi:flagellar hook assembly protein FlgD
MTDVASVTGGDRRFKLEGAYPNPCNPSTTISYVLPVEVKVSLKIFDISGRLVVTLVDEPQAAGAHSIRWHSNVPRGTYFYVLSGGEFSETKKLIVLK